MCDYSLHAVASRPAKVGDRLVTTQFRNSITSGLAASSEPEVAVCLLPGTEVAFDAQVKFASVVGWFWSHKIREKVARFRRVNANHPHMHHDALEFPNGKVVLITRLVENQTLTVLQLPVAKHKPADASEPLPLEM